MFGRHTPIGKMFHSIRLGLPGDGLAPVSYGWRSRIQARHNKQ
jgi:hypothetical protein